MAAASLVAVLIVIGAVGIAWRLQRGDGSLLRNAAVADDQITPNADGENDATRIGYDLARNADVSIFFEDTAGKRYYFRRDEPRGAGEFEVLFSGIVDGYRLPDEETEGQILARLLPDGQYTWVIAAVGENGQADEISGQIAITGGDPVLPEIRDFGKDRDVFTPNQDGISDRVAIGFFLPKEVKDLQVYLEMPDGTHVPISERPTETAPLDRGWHTYDYAAGVDQKAAPPPDGRYPLVAIAEDHEGQKVSVADELEIQLGGVPYASIISPVSGDTLAFNTTSLQICDTLHFTVTVENYGATPIRTTGPWSGAVYDSDWNYNAMGWPTEAGAWRLGIGYENALGDYPFRWGLGSADTLEKIGDHYYLMPGERAQVTGGIRVVNRFGVRNPQPMWAGLIHEDVEISLRNNRVDPHSVTLDLADPDQLPECETRPLPVEASVPR